MSDELADGRLELAVLGRVWTFGRGDGSLIASNVKLMRGGSLKGHRQRNESSWRIDAGALEFLNSDGVVTCRFETTSVDERGAITLTGRFRPLPDCSHVLRETRCLVKLGQSNSGPRVALLVRTHLVNEKLFDLLDLLNQSRRYDLFVTADETKQALDLRGYEKLSHTADAARAHELPHQHSRILWHCGDFPLYFAAAERPDYDYYVMVEYDVDFVRKSPLFLEGLIARFRDCGPEGVDLLTANFGRAYPGWIWASAALRKFPTVYTTGTFAFLAVSKRAVSHLLNVRRSEAKERMSENDIVHCEAFCASALMEGGYECASVNTLVQNAVDRNSFHPGSIDMPNSSFLLNHDRIDDPKVEMIHPVYELSVFLMKEYQKSLRTNNFADFLKRLPTGTQSSKVDSELIARYRDKALAQAKMDDGLPVDR